MGRWSVFNLAINDSPKVKKIKIFPKFQEMDLTLVDPSTSFSLVDTSISFSLVDISTSFTHKEVDPSTHSC